MSDEETFEYLCPGCRVSLTVPIDRVGTEARCNECNATFVVPRKPTREDHEAFLACHIGYMEAKDEELLPFAATCFAFVTTPFATLIKGAETGLGCVLLGAIFSIWLVTNKWSTHKARRKLDGWWRFLDQFGYVVVLHDNGDKVGETLRPLLSADPANIEYLPYSPSVWKKYDQRVSRDHLSVAGVRRPWARTDTYLTGTTSLENMIAYPPAPPCPSASGPTGGPTERHQRREIVKKPQQ